MWLFTALRPLFIGLAILSVMASAARAADFELPFAGMEAAATPYYFSPAGQGKRDGSSESDAMAFTQLQLLIYNLRGSSKLILLPGVYPLNATIDLRTPDANSLLVLEGRENAVIQGSFDFATETGTASGIRLRSGNIVVRRLTFQHTGFCVKAEKNSIVNQVLVENITAKNVHSCIVVDRDVVMPVTRWIIRDSNILGYYRVGIRLAGNQSRDFMLERLHINGETVYAKNDCFKGGIQLLAGVGRVQVRDSVIENNVGSCGSNFQQGDGIEADDRYGIPADITLYNLRISNSGDADMDMKAENVAMESVTALGGPLTHYAFKFWTYDHYSCVRCFATGSNYAFIHLYQASMKFKDSTFAHTRPVHICDLRNGAIEAERAFVSFDKGFVYLGDEAWVNECGEGALSSLTRLAQGVVSPPETVINLQVH